MTSWVFWRWFLPRLHWSWVPWQGRVAFVCAALMVYAVNLWWLTDFLAGRAWLWNSVIQVATFVAETLFLIFLFRPRRWVAHDD